MDDDLETFSRDELVQEVKKLRQGIREHRDSTLHELCWHHPALWGLLPERTDPLPTVPEWPAVHARLHTVSAVARRAGTGCAAQPPALRGVARAPYRQPDRGASTLGAPDRHRGSQV